MKTFKTLFLLPFLFSCSIGPGQINLTSKTDVRILSGIQNQSITLINKSPGTIDLSKWKLIEAVSSTGKTLQEYNIPSGTSMASAATKLLTASTLGFQLAANTTIYLVDNTGISQSIFYFP